MSQNPELRTQNSPFVLVHGAGHGGWCWQRLTPLLRAAGHAVFTPTLTGLGDRRHLARPEVGLETHVEDIASLLFYEDLRNVVLVGHSYSGMVIAGVADRLPERISHLVYLDSVIPEDGESLNDITDAGTVAIMDRRAARYGDGWLLPAAPASRYGITNPDEAAWVEARLVAQPYPPFRDKVRFRNPAGLALPKSYIACTGKETLVASAARARQPGWSYFEIETGHDVMWTRPAELAEVLLSLSAPVRSPG